MQITKNELTKELVEMEDQYGKRQEFDKLPYHKKFTYIVEAERFIKALNNIRKRKSRNGRGRLL